MGNQGKNDRDHEYYFARSQLKKDVIKRFSAASRKKLITFAISLPDCSILTSMLKIFQFSAISVNFNIFKSCNTLQNEVLESNLQITIFI